MTALVITPKPFFETLELLRAVLYRRAVNMLLELVCHFATEKLPQNVTTTFCSKSLDPGAVCLDRVMPVGMGASNKVYVMQTRCLTTLLGSMAQPKDKLIIGVSRRPVDMVSMIQSVVRHITDYLAIFCAWLKACGFHMLSSADRPVALPLLNSGLTVSACDMTV